MCPRTRPLPVALFLASLTVTAADAQQAAQFLDAPMLVVTSPTQRMNALLDFDGDGWKDAVGTFCPTSTTGGVTLFRNDGSGRLVAHWHNEWPQNADNTTYPFPIAVADLNGDAKSDFVVGLRNEIRVFVSNGTSPPTLAHTLLIPSFDEVHDLALGDFDGNGTIDVAARLFDFSGSLKEDRGIRIYNRILTGTPTQSLFITPQAGTGFEMHVASCNADSVADLFCIGNFRVDFFSIQGGAIVVAASFSHGLPPLVLGAAGDVDGDLDEDVALFSMSGSHRVLRRTGPTTYLFSPIVPGGPATDLADVDQDGDLDGVCCGGGGGGPTNFANNVVSYFEVAKNNGAGVFAPSFKIPAYGSNHIAGVADVDHDGDVDLIAGRVVYYNRDGIDPIAYQNFATDYAVADTDADGDPDQGATLSSFERNNGDGSFTVVPRIAPTPPAGSTFAATGFPVDVDGDGAQDMVFTESVGGVPLRERFLRNNGGGGLVDAGPLTADGTTFPTTEAVKGIVAADVNGDGFRDLLIRHFGQSAVYYTRIYFGGANGLVSFSGMQIWESLLSSNDIDADGFTDLITTNGSDVRVRWGSAVNLFAQSTVLVSGTTVLFPDNEPALVADLDDDGDLDVLVGVQATLTSQKAPRICENTGSRAFVFHDDALPGYTGWMLPAVATDVDLDGNTDILVGQRKTLDGANGLLAMTWMRGSAAPGADFDMMGDQWPLAFGFDDFDGDGDVDVLGYNPKHVLFNHHFSAPESGVRKQYGNATAGNLGQKPTFGATGPFRGGLPAELRMTGCTPNAGGILLVGLDDQSAKLAGTGGFVVTLPIIVSLPIVFPGNVAVPGSGSLTIPYTVPLAAVGYSWFHQFVAIDSAAQGGAALSNGLEIYYGP